MTSALPSVEVVIPTHGRPELMRLALNSVLAQTYAGPLSVAIVFDREEADTSLVSDGPIPVRVLLNERAFGLAGSRNAGILSSDADLIAFLDDDDQWRPEKLARQVPALEAAEGAFFATTAIEINYDGIRSDRLAGRTAISHDDLLASRMAMLHSSTFVIRREALVGEFGLVDEAAPSGQNEDWDLLLRASARAAIVHVDDALVSVRWGSTSMFAAAWSSRIAGAEWIVAKHPDIRSSDIGYARVLGQMAFGHAAVGARRDALRTAREGVRVRWREPRNFLALAVASRMVSAGFVQRALHKRGHGM